MLRVKLLRENAKAPTIAYPGDLGYDLYAAESVTIQPKGHAEIGSGIAVEYIPSFIDRPRKYGFLIQEKSSYARRRLLILGGICDSGFRGELKLILENLGDEPQTINAGDKVANLVPIPVLADTVEVVPELSSSLRGERGYGSSGIV